MLIYHLVVLTWELRYSLRNRFRNRALGLRLQTKSVFFLFLFHTFLVSKKIIALERSLQACTFMSWLSDTLALSGNTIRPLLMWIWEGEVDLDWELFCLGGNERKREKRKVWLFLVVRILKIDSLNLLRMKPMFWYYIVVYFVVYFLFLLEQYLLV